MSISVKQNLISKAKYGVKCPYPMDPDYITVHNTYNDAPAENEVAYMIRNDREVSFHFAIDDKEVVQGLPLDRNGWHCGDGGKGTGNRKSIGIEICYSKSGGSKYYQAEGLAIQFIAQLLQERGWGIDRVKKHQDWSKKHCPHRILSENRWDSFKKAIEDELKKLNKPKFQAAAYSLDPIPAKSPQMVRLAKFYDTQNPDIIKKLKEEGYRIIELPQ